MKKTKIFSIITMFIAVVLIITGYSIIFINDYTVDAQEKSSYASLIKTSFTSYNLDLEEISYDIKTMDIFNIKYYSDIKDNYVKNISLLTEIERKIKSVENLSESFLYECQNRDYNDYDIDYKCDIVEYNYESIINAYVSLTKKYNEKFNIYNTWMQTQNLKDTTFLSEYKPSYYGDYIDINLDGEYIGIIE